MGIYQIFPPHKSDMNEWKKSNDLINWINENYNNNQVMIANIYDVYEVMGHAYDTMFKNPIYYFKDDKFKILMKIKTYFLNRYYNKKSFLITDYSDYVRFISLRRLNNIKSLEELQNEEYEKNIQIIRFVKNIPQDICNIIYRYVAEPICNVSITANGVELFTHNIYKFPFTDFPTTHIPTRHLITCIEVNLSKDIPVELDKSNVFVEYDLQNLQTYDSMLKIPGFGYKLGNSIISKSFFSEIREKFLLLG